MGYVLVGEKLHKKDFVKSKVEIIKMISLRGMLHIPMDMLKREGISILNKLFMKVNPLKARVSSSNTENCFICSEILHHFSKNVERSYNTLCGNVLNTLKYFLADH
ncbi:hypothetical protein H5410_036800 [Solanum commersonii]|uniref:Uncharacterized protein n=1 Tax=Solanum commersonii TaxID=4109 RepID=A0A9J5Y7M1_SOLCO|nr:hypothetical protein H5410_036800 [Solanum commersonii]